MRARHDVGGGGNNASHLKAHYDLTLVDASDRMLALSRRINPSASTSPTTCAPCASTGSSTRCSSTTPSPYMVSLDDLRAAMTTAYEHLRPGGMALLCPDHLRDTFVPMTDHGGHDEGARGLRYLEWTWDSDPADTTYTTDFAYVLRDGTDVRAVHDRHVCGLFTREEWCRALADTGFQRIEVHPGPRAPRCSRPAAGSGLRRPMSVQPGHEARWERSETRVDPPQHRICAIIAYTR